jgi:2-polyprenyl-6-methoxyphenol hydroxylase-like FAD-dependent oxidoreductase
MYDAIVVGARCAGAATAMLLARKGHKVLLVDRATFPSDSPTGNCLLYPGVAQLQRWGLLDKVIASGSPPIERFMTTLGDTPVAGRPYTPDGLPAAIGPRRVVLDKILIDAAVRAGAELREAFNVTDVVRVGYREGERIAGVRGVSRGSALTATERAHIVIGADGRHSHIARLVGATAYDERPTLTCWYFAFWDAVPMDGLEIHWRPGRCVYAFPTNDGQTAIFVARPRSEFDAFRADVEGTFLRTLESAPTLLERVRAGGRRASHFAGHGDLPNSFRRSFGTGWALVGDAGHHKDPAGAYGMSDAFRDAELLAQAVDDGLAGKRPLEEALADYERRRDERARPDFEQNCRQAKLTGWDTPEMLQLREALSGNPYATSRYLGVNAKSVQPEDFYAPENLRRILAA